MGQRKSGYVTNEAGNRVEGEMRPGFADTNQARAFDNTRMPDYEAEFIRHAQSHSFDGRVLDRAVLLAQFRRQLAGSSGGLDFQLPPPAFLPAFAAGLPPPAPG